jgi:NADH-quinone oxidoreductase subunit N
MVTANDIYIIAPMLVLSFGALVILLASVFTTAPAGAIGGAILKAGSSGFGATIVTVLIALGCVAGWGHLKFTHGTTAFYGTLYGDPFAYFVNIVILGGTLIAVFLGKERITPEGVTSKPEYYALILLATVGALILGTAAELITLFLGLEIMSMALYCLCGSALTVRRSTESALKYFLLGSFSSAFLLYGIALLYGVTGTTTIGAISTYFVNHAASPVAFIALGLMLVGFAFKVGAAPFHFWAPDVYEGAPTPVTAYMACIIKAAAVAAMLRGLWWLFPTPSLQEAWHGAVWFLAVLTMVVGNFAALRQTTMKRLLAYSSIAHVGYILVALLGQESGGGAAILFYLVSYTVMTLGAFGVVMAVNGRQDNGHQDNVQEGVAGDDIRRFEGLGLREPLLGALMAVFMFALAGLPPGLAGLLGKFYLFTAAIQSDYSGLVIIAVLNSAVSCYYYLKVLVAMYFKEGTPATTISGGGVLLTTSNTLVLSILALLTILLGAFPGVIYHMASAAMQVAR